MSKKKAISLSDYAPYPFLIPKIELDFSLHEKHVDVESTLYIEPLFCTLQPLILQGVDLQLDSISLNGIDLECDSYFIDSDKLVILKTPEKPFKLNLKTRLDPFSNTSLEGLYSSDKMLTTQCEAEGFRRICFHPDRPDVLSTYKVRIEAEREKYPVLISNGNQIYARAVKNNSSRHEVYWEDPFPKPSYLFALVAADLIDVSAEYKSKSGRRISINLYVEHGDEKYTQHAIESLIRAMKWDELVYGLEYDLDEYNIVAVRHFNMGAMENKSLNIFNSKLVLANSEIATDDELERIEGVIAHEYFHNWTGNRITCRDWFQLSLKEGLTVFRDQCFTSDMHSASVKRIQDVRFLRNTQFREDAGPTAHPVKPTKYVAIDNFYTTTIYEKGAELIRMLQTLIGAEGFMAGIELFIERFDGCAVTTEDFVKAIVDGACNFNEELNFDIDQFFLWYSQPGTPQVSISRNWDAQEGQLTLTFQQFAPSLQDKNKSKEDSFVIPVAFALVNSNGRIGEAKLFVLDKPKQELIIEGLPKTSSAPVVSAFRNFTAPVKWKSDLSREESLLLLQSDDDPFSRWEAAQSLIREVIIARANSTPEYKLEESLYKVFEKLIQTMSNQDQTTLATLLQIPGLSELEAFQQPADPIGLYEAIIYFKSFLGKKLLDSLSPLLDRNLLAISFEWPHGCGERKINEIFWSWLALAGDHEIRKQALNAIDSGSMTLARAALNALQPIDCNEREIAFNNFYRRWKNHPIILDTWFALEASTPRPDALDRVRSLLSHPRFDPIAPNSIRAVLGGFASNTKAFHSQDGSGYMFMAEQICSIDSRNPITASRLAKVFSRWRSYVPINRNAMSKAIRKLSKENLSSNTREVVDLIDS